MALLFGVLMSVGAAPAAERLIDQVPYDVVVLDRANDFAELSVYPLAIEPRRMPEPRPSEPLSLRLTDRPSEEFEVSWGAVEEIKFFENLVLEEAQRLASEGEFDGAFEHLDWLAQRYPRLAGLGPTIQKFLRLEAVATFKEGDHRRALAILASLYAQDPQAPGLTAAVDAISLRMLNSYLGQRDYGGARGVLSTLDACFTGLPLPKSDSWRKRFEAGVDRELGAARAAIGQKDFHRAREAIARARQLKPDSAEAQALADEVYRLNPTVVVGVFRPAPHEPKLRCDHPAALRVGPLVAPTITRLEAYPPSGSVYASVFGEVLSDDSGGRLFIDFDPAFVQTHGSQLSPYALARRLLRLADPDSEQAITAFSRIATEVRMEDPTRVSIGLRKPHVKPAATLATAPATGDGLAKPPFVRQDRSESIAAFSARSGEVTIEERRFEDEREAFSAFLGGGLHVLSELAPWRLERLTDRAGVVVGTYRLPTLHALVVSPDARADVLTSEFRRALCYGISRERFVTNLSGGRVSLEGYQAASGPFAAGASLTDPLRYAYSERISPRSFTPQLAAILASVARTKAEKAAGGSSPAMKEPIVLAHDTGPVALRACELIRAQMTAAGVEIELREANVESLLSGAVPYDLRYAELSVEEPLTAVADLLGPEGLGVDCGAAMRMALDRLDNADAWTEVNLAMQEIHEIAHDQLPYVPLWQTVDHYAYREELGGVDPECVRLYENSAGWRLNTSRGAR
ncbi:hypothetical protein Mal64_04040 [Pseudobythopirellula maris]|uniref:Bacterial extracellular solute-binding protein, family 5 Middle n=1 Tax=Pseudobythopirellula maris TaxID=2527991 RepID=A0A5C5ZT78_9BACT|nr:hypothetical protein Mal64_04040 [Pseudobythopirellula maris]